MVWVFKTLLKQENSLVGITLFECLLSEFYTTYLILCGHLTFSTLPWVELVAVEQLHSFFEAPYLIEQGNFFEQEVVALSDEFRIQLQECKTLVVWSLETTIQLIELHQYA